MYIDDVLIYSQPFEKHLRKFEHVFVAYEKAELRIKGRKSHICCTEVPYLGQLLSFDKIRMDSKRVHSIVEMPPFSKR